MDTYKVATVANSESTMHRLTKTPITRQCFMFDPENEDLLIYENHHGGYYMRDFIDGTIEDCERLRILFLQTKDLRYWRALIQMLPEGWMQKRTWTGSYATCRNIHFARRNHKLQEWRIFTNMFLTLPYGKELITIE